MIAFRPFGETDLARLQRWLAEPHVARWWRRPADPAAFAEKYGSRLSADHPVRVYVIALDGEAAGIVQYMPLAPGARRGSETVMMDILLGEPDLVGRSLGPRIIDAFVTRVIFANPAIGSVMADPQTENLRSVRAFEKAGFRFVEEVSGGGCAVSLLRRDR